jgi:predicted N-formylglutamate amidohydrolase
MKAEFVTLLSAGDPPAVEILRPQGTSPFFLLGDHAGRQIPARLGDLGLPAQELERHIAWDPGIAPVTRMMSERLDATAILQLYSRLVIDCNRPIGSETSIATLSETTEIPGNCDLTPHDKAARADEIFIPYHDAIRHALDARAAQKRSTILIAMHSFTPVYKGERRPWHAGVLYRETALAQILLKLLRAEDGLIVGDNEPYTVNDDTDFSIPVHGEQRRLPHAAIEIRQDLIATPQQQTAWAERMVRLLTAAGRMLDAAAPDPTSS